MADARSQRVIHVECPACHWTKAVLAYENAQKRCFLCPHCQHVWDTTETASAERARLARRTTELGDRHDILEDGRFDQPERKGRRRKHLADPGNGRRH